MTEQPEPEVRPADLYAGLYFSGDLTVEKANPEDNNEDTKEGDSE